MLRYIIVRLGQAAITLVGVSIIVFALYKNIPTHYYVDFGNDSGKAIHYATWDINDSWYVQYFTFVKNAVEGEFGPSLKWEQRTAMEMALLTFPRSLQLAFISIGATLLLAVPLGIVSAVKKGNPWDILGRGISRLGQSVPPFWLGIMLIWIFAVNLEWLPSSGAGDDAGNWVLPVMALGFFPMAVLVRLTRASMLEVMGSNYVKMARIRGIPEWKVVWKHGLANAVPTVLTSFPVLAAFYLVNVVAIEMAFAWPGAGFIAVYAADARDYQVVQPIILLASVLVVGAGLLIDILRAAIDPRVRHGQGEAHHSRAVEVALP